LGSILLFWFLLCSPDPAGETDVSAIYRQDTAKRGGPTSQRLVFTHGLAFLFGESRALFAAACFGQQSLRTDERDEISLEPKCDRRAGRKEFGVFLFDAAGADYDPEFGSRFAGTRCTNSMSELSCEMRMMWYAAVVIR
jgi:hypothetical protein